MWNKQAESEPPNNRPSMEPIANQAAMRPSVPTARNLSCLGAGIEIKGTISGTEDLQIDGKVSGPISLRGQKLTVGLSGKVNAEIAARDVVVYGDVNGNVVAQDRVEIKNHASVVGDIKAARISIEDGARCKGRIEIERGKTASHPSEQHSVSELVPAGVN